ncbi:USP6 N-terminal-like protein isoform X2 [Lampetra fluviatilis]
MNTETEKDAALRLSQERAEIIEKYDRGREEGAQIDPWEDSDFRLYKVTDRFGFLHEEELPIPDAEEGKIKATEVERVAKWLKMVKTWDKYKNTEKMARRVYKGLPLQLRGEIWSLLLELSSLKEEFSGLYEQMKQRARMVSPDVRQIDLDVNRTFRNHIMFRNRYGVKQQALFHVLAAYSMYNTEVGYCQGMSQIAALLLMYLNEEDAFWALVRLLSDNKHAMHGFFVPGFPKLMRFQEHHDLIMKRLLPKMKKHLDSQEIFTNLYTTKWFFQCFLDRTPFTLTLRLWDIYMLDGERLLIAMAYTTLKLHKKRLMKMEMEGLVGFLQQSLNEDFLYEDHFVIDQLHNNMAELRRNKLLQPPPGKQDEFPQRPFGQMPPDSLTILEANGAANGQNRQQQLTPTKAATITAPGPARTPSPQGNGKRPALLPPRRLDGNVRSVTTGAENPAAAAAAVASTAPAAAAVAAAASGAMERPAIETHAQKLPSDANSNQNAAPGPRIDRDEGGASALAAPPKWRKPAAEAVATTSTAITSLVVPVGGGGGPVRPGTVIRVDSVGRSASQHSLYDNVSSEREADGPVAAWGLRDDRFLTSPSSSSGSAVTNGETLARPQRLPVVPPPRAYGSTDHIASPPPETRQQRHQQQKQGAPSQSMSRSAYSSPARSPYGAWTDTVPVSASYHGPPVAGAVTPNGSSGAHLLAPDGSFDRADGAAWAAAAAASAAGHSASADGSLDGGLDEGRHARGGRLGRDARQSRGSRAPALGDGARARVERGRAAALARRAAAAALREAGRAGAECGGGGGCVGRARAPTVAGTRAVPALPRRRHQGDGGALSRGGGAPDDSRPALLLDFKVEVGVGLANLDVGNGMWQEGPGIVGVIRKRRF